MYRIEDIIDYVQKHRDKYIFTIREYASGLGDYTNEAVLFGIYDNEVIGIIFEDCPINPYIYYTESEVKELLDKLNKKAKKYAARATIKQIL